MKIRQARKILASRAVLNWKDATLRRAHRKGWHSLRSPGIAAWCAEIIRAVKDRERLIRALFCNAGIPVSMIVGPPSYSAPSAASAFPSVPSSLFRTE